VATHPQSAPGETNHGAVRTPISLVIPVRNEAATLAVLWQSIQDQTLPPDEIVMVDGGSTDATVEVARRLAAGDPRVHIEVAGPATPGRGRNVGIALASHDWIALTDAGVRLDPTWLEELVRAREASPSALVVYGNYEPLVTSFLERCASLAYVSLRRDTPAGRMRGPSAFSTLLHRSAWAAVGGFPDARATEDLVFISRLEEQATATAWAPAATARWAPRSSLSATYRRYSAYSTQAVLSGRQRDWHHQIIWKYALGAPFLALGLRRHWGFCVVPAAGASARVAAAIWRRREGVSAARLLDPAQFVGVATVIFTIDVATFVGWGRALRIKAKGAGAIQAELQRPS